MSIRVSFVGLSLASSSLLFLPISQFGASLVWKRKTGGGRQEADDASCPQSTTESASSQSTAPFLLPPSRRPLPPRRRFPTSRPRSPHLATCSGTRLNSMPSGNSQRSKRGPRGRVTRPYSLLERPSRSSGRSKSRGMFGIRNAGSSPLGSVSLSRSLLTFFRRCVRWDRRDSREKGRPTPSLSSSHRLLAEIVDDINQMSSHLLEVARLHEEVYGGRFDVEARLVALERAEKERQQREWAEGTSSAASSSAPNSPFKSVSVRTVFVGRPACDFEVLNLDGAFCIETGSRTDSTDRACQVARRKDHVVRLHPVHQASRAAALSPNDQVVIFRRGSQRHYRRASVFTFPVRRF